jgi:hypothetical protein
VREGVRHGGLDRVGGALRTEHDASCDEFSGGSGMLSLEVIVPRGGRGAALLLVALMLLSGFLVARLSQPNSQAPGEVELSRARSDLAAQRTMPTGVFLDTALGGAADATLGLGFLHPTAAGAWMAQFSADLRFAVLDGVTPVSLEIALRPLVAASDRERQVTIVSSVDEVKATLTGGRETVLVALDGKPEQLVSISCDDINSPIGLQLGPDRRAFCALVFGYTINAEGG